MRGESRGLVRMMRGTREGGTYCIGLGTACVNWCMSSRNVLVAC